MRYTLLVLALVGSVLDRIVQASTAGPGMAAARQAHQVFTERGGAFEDGDPFFEERTQAFLDWFVLGYREESGRTAAERFLAAHPSMSEDERLAVVGLCRAMRGLFRIEDVSGGIVRCTELLGGAAFAAEPLGDASGLGRGDVADGHVVPFRGQVVLCKGLVFHPREAEPAVESVVRGARAAGIPREVLLFALLHMRMRYDRYRGIRAEKIYRFPFRGFP
jgi:hypothetical protein